MKLISVICILCSHFKHPSVRRWQKFLSFFPFDFLFFFVRLCLFSFLLSISQLFVHVHFVSHDICWNRKMSERPCRSVWRAFARSSSHARILIDKSEIRNEYIIKSFERCNTAFVLWKYRHQINENARTLRFDGTVTILALVKAMQKGARYQFHNDVPLHSNQFEYK